MTVIYITEDNCQCYAVTFENKGWVKVQKFEDETLDENIIYTVNPMKSFLGISQRCSMTALSGAFDESCFDYNTILNGIYVPESDLPFEKNGIVQNSFKLCR